MKCTEIASAINALKENPMRYPKIPIYNEPSMHFSITTSDAFLCKISSASLNMTCYHSRDHILAHARGCVRGFVRGCVHALSHSPASPHSLHKFSSSRPNNLETLFSSWIQVPQVSLLSQTSLTPSPRQGPRELSLKSRVAMGGHDSIRTDQLSCEICDDMDRKSCYSSQGKLPILDQDSP